MDLPKAKSDYLPDTYGDLLRDDPYTDDADDLRDPIGRIRFADRHAANGCDSTGEIRLNGRSRKMSANGIG